MKLKPLHLALIVGAAILIVGFFFAITSFGAPTVQAPSTLDDAALEAKALEIARISGLQGDPTATRFEYMTVSEWYALIGAGPSAEEADTPVFVYVLRGDVIWLSPDLPQPGQTEPNRYDNMIVVLDAHTGEMRGILSSPNADDLPVEMP